MQLSNQTSAAVSAAPFVAEEQASQVSSRYAEYKIIRRNGAVVGFEPSKIAIAVTKAFLAVNGGQGAASARIRELVATLTETVVTALMRRQPNGRTFHIEDIQDQVELALMRSGEHEVARAYVLYREQRAQERAKQRDMLPQSLQAHPVINVVENGKTHPLDMVRLNALVHEACEGLGRAVDPEKILQATLKDLYEGVPVEEVRKSLILSSRSMIEKDPAYSYVTARLLLNTLRLETVGEEVTQAEMKTRYAEVFPKLIKRGIEAELLDERIAGYDLKSLGEIGRAHV